MAIIGRDPNHAIATIAIHQRKYAKRNVPPSAAFPAPIRQSDVMFKEG